MPTIETTSHVDIDLCDFDNAELIDELKTRGVYFTDLSEFNDVELRAEVESRGDFVTSVPTDLTQHDIEYLLSVIPTGYKIGSPEYFIYEKLVRIKQYAKN